MNFELLPLSLPSLSKHASDVLVVLVDQGGPASLKQASKDDLSRQIMQALSAGDFSTNAGRILETYAVAGVQARRVIWVGAGDGTLSHMRTALQAAWSLIKTCKPKTCSIAALSVRDPVALEGLLCTWAELSYVYTTTKSKASGRPLSRTRVLCQNTGEEWQNALRRAQAIIAGVEWAKEWANRPPNSATPRMLSDAARKTVKQAQSKAMSCEVLGPKEVAKLKMGAFMAVAQGSDEPLQFIVMRYQGAAATQAPIALVGKGITFDSGGISLKPGAGMDEMKFDMGGAASVLGLFKVLAELKPSINVIGIIPACENMPSGRAVKPGDVVVSMSGQTIEILNTDAEGRLILCDALHYVQRYKPSAIVDIATLTGACVIALGHVRSGLFCNDDALAQALLNAGEQSNDLCWRMPIDDSYAEGLKSPFADVANVGPREGGSITAAKFLQRFVGDCAWAHLDVAGTAWKSGGNKGATGRPVALLTHYVLGQVKRGTASVKAKKSR